MLQKLTNNSDFRSLNLPLSTKNSYLCSRFQLRGALIRRAEIIPINLIRVMPAEGKEEKFPFSVFI